MNIDVLRRMNLLRRKNTFSGKAIELLLDDVKQHFVIKWMLGNKEKSHVVDWNIDPEYRGRSQFVPLHESQAEVIGLTVCLKPKNGSADFISIGRFATNSYDVRSETPMIIDGRMTAHTREWQKGSGSEFLLKHPLDITISSGGELVAEFKKGGIDCNAIITLISGGGIVNDGVLSCGRQDDKKGDNRSVFLIAESVINRGAILCDSEIDKIIIICTEYQSTGVTQSVPDLIIGSRPFDTTPFMTGDLLKKLCRWVRIPSFLLQQLQFEKANVEGQSVWERLAKLNINALQRINVLREKAAFDGAVIASVLNQEKHPLLIKTQFGNKAGSTVTECDIDLKVLSRCIPLSDSQSATFGLSIFVKPSNGSADFITLGRLTTDVYELTNRTPLIIDQTLNVPTFDSDNQIGGKIKIKCSSDIEISERGSITGVVANFVNTASSKRVKGIINLVSDRSVIINGSITCTASDNVKYEGPEISISAETFSNHGTVECVSVIGAVEIKCSRYINTGFITCVPNIIMLHNNGEMGVKSEVKGAVWSESEVKVEMAVHNHRGHHSPHHPKNTLIDDGDSAYESDGSLKRAGDWIIYKLSDIVKLSRIHIRSWQASNCIKSVALWMGKKDGEWFKICEDITKIQKQSQSERKTPQTFNLSLIASDEQLLAEKADLLMLEFLENHGHSTWNTFTSIQMFGYPLNDQFKSE